MEDCTGTTDTSNTSTAARTPSSPPSVAYDGSIADEVKLTAVIPNSAAPIEQKENIRLASPEAVRGSLQLHPRTPRSIAPSSAYYTAVWGSPYDASPSQFSRSARTAFSEQGGFSDFDLTSSPSFNLEHLVPSRLGDLSYPDTINLPYLALSEDNQTPRSRTKRWVQLPVRDDESEAVHWWSDESVPSELEHREEEHANSPTRRRSGRGASRPRHNTREQNRTLDQQSFWSTLRGQPVEEDQNMASLMESRWAATPEPSAEAVSSTQNVNVEVRDEPNANDEQEEVVEATGIHASRWADTPNSGLANSFSGSRDKENQDPLGVGEKVLRSHDVVRKTGSREGISEKRSGATGILAAEQSSTSRKTEQSEARVSVTPPSEAHASMIGTPVVSPSKLQRSESAQNTRVEPARLRKRVSWRGKNIVIAIPRHDYAAAGLEPLSKTQLEARLQRFEEAGYNTSGFDLDNNYQMTQGPAHVKPIFPDESEARHGLSKDQIKIVLPDLDQWKRYMDWLTERKLAALGVSLGFDEPAAPLSQDKPRQSSGQYPPLPFSPPIPTLSASGMRPTGRGHSHTMSVASPGSPLGGVYGHMHRHSTFTGGPINFLMGQQPLMSPNLAGMPPFSTQQQMAMPPFASQQQPGIPRGASPAQITALRHDLGSMRGPGSPLSQQLHPGAAQEYSRGLGEQQRRQHSYSQSMAAPSAMPHSFMPMGSQIRYTPAPLPELAEGDDEEDLMEKEAEDGIEPPAYVPPQKRVQSETPIAVPTPRGHRHNISESLEREVLETERKHIAEQKTEPAAPLFPPRVTSLPNQTALPPLSQPVEKDPLGADYEVRETNHSRKKSTARLNVAAPAFTFNPGAVFQPVTTGFAFGASAPAPAAPAGPAGHSRRVSSGNFNVNAPSFKPTTSEFSFTSTVPTLTEQAPQLPTHTIVDELPSIFGKVVIPDIVKPARRSKAIPILRPEDSDEDRTGISGVTSGTDYEDDSDGRVAQGEAKRKQSKKAADDGDSVPLFAEPSLLPSPVVVSPQNEVLESVADDTVPAVDEGEDLTGTTIDEISEPEKMAEVETMPFNFGLAQPATGASEKKHGHRHSTSLSALAKPFLPPALHSIATDEDEDEASHGLSYSSISDLEEGEIRDDDTSASTLRSNNYSIAGRDFALPQASIKNVQDFHLEPSFDEIDAVMTQLNAQESEDKEDSPVRLPSPGSHPMKGVTYLADWHRGDERSPSHSHHLQQEDTTQGAHVWGAHQLNKAKDVPTSDWSGLVSPIGDDELQDRSPVFDDHIAEIIGRAVHERLMPLEETLRTLSDNASRRGKSSEFHLKRTPSNADSDADDEDDLNDDRSQRPISRGRDKRVDQIKVAVREALREHNSTQEQAASEIQELHSALTDMKISLARAASANLDLGDIRAIVEETMSRQSQALVTTHDSDERSHRRQMSELQGRLNETLAGAPEEADQRRAIEERETELRRQLRLAEEELQLLRDGARDDESRDRAMEQEREELISRLQRKDAALRSAEERLEDSEAQNGALQATLDEYRTSSKKWREDIEDGKRVREELEHTLSLVQRQAEDSQDSSAGMRRRLEKLHSDMATAVGQLASEKATWKATEGEYRAQIESTKMQRAISVRERTALEDELRAVRVAALEASEARHALDHVRASNTSLEETVRKLQQELIDQQELTSRYERQWHDAQESGRSEVHRTRMSMETQIESANHQVNIVRAELETELKRARSEVENLRMEAEMTKARHADLLEQEESNRREALRKTNHSNSVALDEARQKYEASVQDLKAQHSRSLQHAHEDKNRIESFLGERLALSDAKLQHFQERCTHLEERLEVTKTAAQAAAQSAKGGRTAATQHSSGMPEKISPQALRESILVLQEQLQERESRIERLQSQVEVENVAKLKERDAEISFLRELLAVRNEELTDLVNTISRPDFDRAAVRDNAIRIRANLQMEQQEKDRFRRASPPLNQTDSPVGSALASLTNLATPKAAQLSNAFSKWRSSMESSALKAQQQRQQQYQARLGNGSALRSSTPSKTKDNPSSIPTGYHAGLMTPPASNLPSSPVPDDDGSASIPAPRLHARSGSSDSNDTAKVRPHSRHASSTTEETPATPLFREQSYDRDAEDSAITMRNFDEDEDEQQEAEDDCLDDVDDEEPPAFKRNLEAELVGVGGD